MTCIVSWIENGNIWMGGDAGATDKFIDALIDNPKVVHNPQGKMLFGFTGSYRLAQLLQYQLKIPLHPKGEEDMSYMVKTLIPAIKRCLRDGNFSEVENEVEHGGFFLIGYKSKVYEVQQDYSVLTPLDHYFTIGSGYSVAFGALSAVSHYDDIDPMEKLSLALTAAEKHLSYIRRPFTVMHMDPKGKLVKVYRKK